MAYELGAAGANEPASLSSHAPLPTNTTVHVPDPPYLHLSVTASGRFGVSGVMITLVWGWLSLLPVP